MAHQLLRFWVLLSVLGFPLLLNATVVTRHPEVVVSVFNDAGVDVADLVQAQTMASKIYNDAGVSIVWQNCDSQLVAGFSPCLQTSQERHLVLHIEAHARAFMPEIYGVAFLGSDGSGTYCDVFYDRIMKLHHASRSSVGRVLGAVTAHELGHLLLGLRAHSQTGIMRPQLQPVDFSTAQIGVANFTPEQKQEILEGLREN
jgi:hypothetical protein